MRHSQNTFINMFNINTKNVISFSEIVTREVSEKKIYSPMQNGLYMLNAEVLLLDQDRRYDALYLDQHCLQRSSSDYNSCCANTSRFITLSQFKRTS